MAPRASTSSAAESKGPAIRTSPLAGGLERSQRLQLFHHLLATVEVGVEPAPRDQLLVGSRRDDSPLVEHDDAVHPEESRAPVGREQDRGPLLQEEERLEDPLL